MRQKKLLSITLLVMAMLCGGVNGAWAETVWKTYKTWDFVTDFAASDVSGLLPSDSWSTSGSGTSTVAQTSKNISSATAVTTSTSSKYYGLLFQGESSKLQFGNTGVVLGGGATVVTIPNLKTGQRVTVTIDNANGVEVYSGSVATLTDVTTSKSGSYYKTVGIVGTSGNLAIKRYGSATFRIRSILVETPVVYETPALYSQDFESYTAGEDTPTSAGWTLTGGVGSIEEASSNKYAKFVPNSTSGNRGQYYNFASASVTTASNYWKIEFDAALTKGNDRTATSVAVTSSNSGNIATNEAASGNLYFLCVQKANNSQEYNIYLGNSTETAVQTCTLTDGTFYHFTITYDGTTVSAKIGSNSMVTKAVSSSTVGTLKGLKTCESRSQGIVCIDNITLHNFLPPSFTMSEDSKDINEGSNTTVDVTSVVGDISVSSSDETKATASYSDGTLTINGVAKGTATITVSCFKNALTVSKSIDVTVKGYDEQYAEEKAPYDTKVESLDAAGQAYWSANVTPVASVTTASEYATAVAALPTTYIAAVKAQGDGSNMTDAMPTGNAGWTCSQGNGPATVKETFTETYGAESAFVEGNIMSQTITGLQNGYYKVQFYGVVNAARLPSALTVNTDGLAQAYANSTNEEITVYYQDDCTPSDYLHTIEAQVTDGTLTYGLRAKTGVEDAGNWAVAKIYKLTYLGTDKNTYTINAVAGETTIMELATGSVWASETYGTYVPKAVLYNSKYYVLDDGENPNLSSYYASYTMGATNETKEINYTLDESIVAFVESGSNIDQSATNNSSYSSGNYGHVNSDKSVSMGTLTTGMYQFEAYYVSNSNRGLYLRDAGNGDKTTNVIVYQTLSSAGVVSENFLLNATTSVIFTGYTNQYTKYNQSAEFDYVLIRRIGEVATIGSTGWSTFASPYALDLSSMTASEGSVKAYYASSIGASSVTMTSTESSAVAAGEGLMLKGTPSATITIPVKASGSAISGNKLVGVTSNQTFTKDTENYANFYVLSINGSGNAEFQKLKNYLDAGNSVTINAGKAYLDATGAAARLSIVFDDETTGVADVRSKMSEVRGEYYNLSGQRVAQPTKGLYIVNGKKIIMK